MSVTDPQTGILVAAVPMAIALAASYVPARRATRVDPMISLCWEWVGHGRCSVTH